MKHFVLGSLAIFALLGSAQAEVVIDDFRQPYNVTQANSGSGAPLTLNNDQPGTRFLTVNPAPIAARPPVVSTFTGDASDSFYADSSGAVSVQGKVNFDYSFSQPLQLINGLTNLSFDMFKSLTGTWTAKFIANNSGTDHTGHLVVSSGSVINWTPTATTISSLQIQLVSTSPSGTISNLLTSGGARIVANPEPASMVLLGLTGLGAVLIARRRKKTQEVA